jgi:hypothetical protein
MIRRITAALAAAAALTAVVALPAHAVQPATRTNTAAAVITGGVIQNTSTTLSLGVIHGWKGTGPYYSKGLYDVALPPRGFTTEAPAGWTDADGFYIGKGYAATTWMWEGNARGWVIHHVGLPAGQYRINENQWRVTAYNCYC